MREAKQVHYKKLGEKLSDPQTGSKHFWNAFIRITNKRKHTKIPPIVVNNTYVSNFQQKANIFNDHFANQCKILENSSTLPEVTLNTNASIYHAKITINNIVGIISKMSPKKAGGYDGISVTMLQLCTTEVAKPLKIIFEKCLNTGMFPDSWKYANVQPIHKGNRQIKSNYRPISPLPICEEILEKIVFDQLYSYLNTHNLLSKNQSGFRSGDSTIYQLISITSNIFESFEEYDETRIVFLDISKALDEVWHEGVLYKLK